MSTVAELTEDFLGAAIGSDILVANTIFDNISGTAAAAKFFDSSPAGTSKACRVVTGSNTNKILRADYTAAGTMWFAFYLWVEARPSTTTDLIAQWSNTATVVGNLRLTPSGVLQLRDNFSQVWLGTTPLATGEWHRIEIKCVANSGTGHEVKVYSGANLHTTTVSQQSGTQTATGAAQTQTNRITLGIQTGSDATVRFARIRGDNATAPAPPVVGPPAPTVNAGTDQTTSLEPGETFTLTATSSETSVSWTQISGPTAALSGSGLSRTGTVPAGLTGGAMVFRATATNATGTATDDVSIGPALAVTEKVYSGGVLQPVVVHDA